MPDISRRQILAGLLAAPVVAPAAVWGASNALGTKAAPAVTRVRHFHTGGFAEAPQFSVLKPVAPREGSRRQVIHWTDGVTKQWGEVFTNGQWVKVEEPAAVASLIDIDPAGADETPVLEIDPAADYGPKADVLDEDAATYCAVA